MPERRRSQDGYVDSDNDTSEETPAKSPERGFFGGSKEPDKGRKWDHARQGDPVILQAGGSSPWKTFVKSSMYGPALDEDGRRVDESFLEEQTPGYVQPWRGDVEGGDPEKALGLTRRKIRQRMWYQRIQVGTHKLHYLLQLTVTARYCYAPFGTSLFPSDRSHHFDPSSRPFMLHIPTYKYQHLSPDSFDDHGNCS